MTRFAALVLGLILARWLAQVILEWLNRRHVGARLGTRPPGLEAVMDEPTYRRAAEYTLAKGRLQQLEVSWDAVVLCIFLFSGILPAFLNWFRVHLGSSIWSMAAFLIAAGVVLSIAGLPWSWYHQFRLEQKFGFNTSSQKTWWLDRIKGFFLILVIGLPLLALILKLFDAMGTFWWLWAWAALVAFQLLMSVLAPVLILPIFNKLTPLPEGSLRARLLTMAQKTEFRAQSIQVMDGSKRSRHSNAFFTGFGAFRKIVLFDTLVEHLAEKELEAVLAHEIGHYKKKHIPKLLLVSALSSLAALYILSVFARQDWFYTAFGFPAGSFPAALLLFALLTGLVTFWFSPVGNAWSRRYEFQADAFAAEAMAEERSLVEALRKLNRENLSNLNPHPLYSSFYYSHPTLLEREAALAVKA